MGLWTEKEVVQSTVLPTVARETPTKHLDLGPLRPTEGSTVGSTTPFSVHYPISLVVDFPPVVS